MSIKHNLIKSDRMTGCASTLWNPAGSSLASLELMGTRTGKKEGNTRPESENEIIAGKIQHLERLLEEAMSDDITVGDKLRINNNELQGALDLLASSLPSRINELLFLLEEEKVLRENLEAELTATTSRWRAEVEKLESLVDRLNEERASAREQISMLGGESPRSKIEDLRRKIVELETECESLRSIIRNSQSRC
jgi:chromosome segregation ATPase